MSKKIAPLGSKHWLEQVFSSPSIWNLKGRSKHTQYHHIRVMNGRELAGVQGRREAIAALSLDYLANLGIVKRFKSQPFETRKDEFEREIKPDFLVEVNKCEVPIVVEIKTDRFLTNLVRQKLDWNREKFSEFGLKYLVWTDKTPLSRHLRHNLLSMRKHSGEVTEQEQQALFEHVSKKCSTTFGALYREEFDFGAVCAAAWKGRVFFPITKEVRAETIISCTAQENYRAIFLGLPQGGDAWWNSLNFC